MQPLSSVQLAVIVATSTVVIDVIRRFLRDRQKRNGLPLPPGPTKVPVLGNVLSIDREQPWKTYTKWHRIYGDIFHLRLLDQDVIVLGSHSVAVELLEKRSHIYSDRPFIASIEPYGIDCIFAFTPYGDHWRSCRRIVHQTYRADAVPRLRPMQLRNARQLVMNMIEYPDRYEHHYFVFATGVSLSAAYDYDINGKDHLIVDMVKEFARTTVPAATPERATLLKLFPFILHFPDWLLGSSIKHEARRTRDISEKLKDIPYQYVEERMNGQEERPIVSMVSDHIHRMNEYGDESYLAEYLFTLKKAGVSTLLAGSETTASSLMVFTLAMVLNPRIWKRAQAEIDAAVGIDRLPDFHDRHALPYVDAIIRETVRWSPVVPMGIWHATSDSDTYNGQYIPKGATVVANAWAMSRDETRFPNPEEFIPERFLNDEGKLDENNPFDFALGFGRRICPGRYAVDASLFSSIATMLATLEFSAPKDAEGNDLTFPVEWLSGVTFRPEPFPCCISPRAHVNISFLERMLTGQENSGSKKDVDVHSPGNN